MEFRGRTDYRRSWRRHGVCAERALFPGRDCRNRALETSYAKKPASRGDARWSDNCSAALRALFTRHSEAVVPLGLRDLLFERVLGAAPGNGKRVDGEFARLWIAARVFRSGCGNWGGGAARTRSKLSVEWVVSGATVVFAGVILALATLHRLPLLCILILFGGAAWTVFMSTFNTLVQNLVPDWVRARVLAIYLFVFQGSVALGSTLWGVAAEHTSANTALLFSSIGIAACLALPVVARLPAARGSLEAWNHWGKLSMVTQPEPDEGPVLIAIEYRVDPEKVPEFLDALHDLPADSKTRRRHALGRLLRCGESRRISREFRRGVLGGAHAAARSIYGCGPEV
jgi:Transmembrane secretion effector